MTFIVCVALALTVAYRATTADERERYLRFARRAVGNALLKAGGVPQEGFRSGLRELMRLGAMTLTLAALNAMVVVMMLPDSRPLGDPDMIVAWGGNVGPRTANGEWWRLITSLFVHPSLLHLFVNLVGLVPLGVFLERHVGGVAIVAAYLASGLFAGLFSLSAFPMTVSVGASGAVAGVYGLALAASMWGVIHRSRLRMRSITVKWLAGSWAVFVAYTLVVGTLAAAVVGLVTGFLFGVITARDVNVRRSPAVRVAAVMTTALFIAMTTAIPLRGITDALPDIRGIVALEERTSITFRTAADRFTAGRISAEALADVIDTIRPTLKTARARLDVLDRLPQEQQPLVAAAEQYLQLRDESWRIRAEALRGHSMRMLREADEKEAASLEALRRIR